MIAIAILMQIPQWLALQNSLSHGFPVELNSDEDLYLSHVEEALSGRPAQAAEAVTGDPAVIPLQSALLEQVIGMAFAWTHLRAITVLQILDSVMPPLLFLILFWFLRRCGFSQRMSFVGALLFFILELYSLNRPIHQRDSFLLVLLSLSCILESQRGKRFLGFLGGALLGLLVGVYFWSWTFAWAFFGLLMLFEFSEWAHGQWHPKHPYSAMFLRALSWMRDRLPLIRTKRVPRRSILEWQWLILYGCMAVLFATPFVLQLFAASSHPLYPDVLRRLELIHSRALESPVRSVLFLLMVAGLGGAYIRAYPLLRRYREVILFLLTALIVLNQQLIHGVTFLFSSHYLFAFVLAGVSAFLLSIIHLRSSRWLILSLIGSVVFLAGIAFDARQVLLQFQAHAERYAEHHLVSALSLLDALPRATILSDPATMRFIMSHTHHDVPYSSRLNYMLIADADLAERYCLAKLPLPIDDWKIGSETVLFYDPDRIAMDPSLRSEERSLATAACLRQSKDPPATLRRYGVTYVLWNEKRQPQWDLKRLRMELEKVAGGEGWSLWKI